MELLRAAQSLCASRYEKTKSIEQVKTLKWCLSEEWGRGAGEQGKRDPAFKSFLPPASTPGGTLGTPLLQAQGWYLTPITLTPGK